MIYFIYPNKDTGRLEIVVTNHKGNEEARIHGDDTLKFCDGKHVVGASTVFEQLSQVEITKPEASIKYES